MVSLEYLRDLLGNSIITTGQGVINFIPTLVLAVIIFAIGWIVAALIERVIESLFKSARVDSLLRSAGLEDVMKRTGYALNSGRFVGALVKWFIIIVFLVVSFEILQLQQVNAFLQGEVLSFLPKLIVSILILMVAVVIADAMQKIVTASAHAAHVKSAHLLGVLSRWAIWIFALLAVLSILGIGELLSTIITYLFAGVALAIGLAFGLGGKDYAAGVIDRTMHKLSDKE